MKSFLRQGVQSVLAGARSAAARISLKNWVLIELDRHVLAAIVVAAGFVLFIWLEFVGVLDVERDATSMLYLFSTLAGGNVTLITIVVSINQLILSRELRSPRELKTEMHAAAEFRNEVEAESDRLVVPERPAEFLRLLLADTREQVTKLDDVGTELDDPDVRSDVEALVTALRSDFDLTASRLQCSRDGVFPALSTILEVDFATHLNHARWLKRASDGPGPDSTLNALRVLEQHLEQLDVARQYFKTVYIKQELADVSVLVMTTGLVAVLVALAFIAVAGSPETTIPFSRSVLLVPLAVGVDLIPLALLISHVLRIAAVARRTAAITPFLAPTD
ncbi:MAG: hypothetical protein ABEJ28_08745 [Salinigranum sp.]